MLPTVTNQIRSHALKNGSKVAFVEYSQDRRRELTYEQFYYAALRYATNIETQLLSNNVHPKADVRIALVAGNILELHIFYLACAMLGFVAVPINITFTPPEIAEVLATSRPSLLFCEERFLATCRAAAENVAHLALLPIVMEAIDFSEIPHGLSNEPANESIETLMRPWAILHTSGTTSGKKKGVMRNQFGTIAGIFVHLTAMRLSDKDVFMAVWPSYGISTFFFAFGLLYLGGRIVLLDADSAADPAVSWEILLDEEVTFTTGSPLHFENWSRIAKRQPSDDLRIALLSGATVSAQNKVALADALGERCLLCEAYGSTECGVITLSADVSKEGVGCEPSGVPRIKLDEITNEILVSKNSPMFMLDYILAETESQDCFVKGTNYFRTGDVGRRDAEGNLLLLGRVDDRIGLPNGHDLYPAEVEIVLAQLLTDRQVVVSLVNERLVGIITGTQSDTLVDELKKHAERNLAPIKRPTRFIFVDELPMTSTNKVKRKDIPTLVSKL